MTAVLTQAPIARPAPRYQRPADARIASVRFLARALAEDPPRVAAVSTGASAVEQTQLPKVASTDASLVSQVLFSLAPVSMDAPVAKQLESLQAVSMNAAMVKWPQSPQAGSTDASLVT